MSVKTLREWVFKAVCAESVNWAVQSQSILKPFKKSVQQFGKVGVKESVKKSAKKSVKQSIKESVKSP